MSVVVNNERVYLARATIAPHLCGTIWNDLLEVALCVKSQSTFHITMTNTIYETRQAQLRLLLVD
jgi:hypothetical protein